MHYNDKNINDREFLTCVMHDPSLPLVDRMRAAKALLKLGPPPPPPPPVVLRIRIEGLSHEDLGRVQFASFSPELQADLLYLKRCYEAGFSGPFDLEDMDIKGHG